MECVVLEGEGLVVGFDLVDDVECNDEDSVGARSVVDRKGRRT